MQRTRRKIDTDGTTAERREAIKRTLAIALSLANDHDHNRLTYSWDYDDYPEYYPNRKKEARVLAKALPLAIFKNGGLIFFAFQNMQADGNGITVTFTETFKRMYVTGMAKHFADPLFPVTILSLASPYAKRMYPILLAHEADVPKPFTAAGNLNGRSFSLTYTVAEIEDELSFTEGYSPSQVKDACTAACDEINALNTPYLATVDFNFTGGRRNGRLTHICWSLAKKAAYVSPYPGLMDKPQSIS